MSADSPRASALRHIDLLSGYVHFIADGGYETPRQKRLAETAIPVLEELRDMVLSDDPARQKEARTFAKRAGDFFLGPGWRRDGVAKAVGRELSKVAMTTMARFLLDKAS